MTKRPQTIYSSNDKCNKEQKEECDYKYLARVWFYRSLTIFVLSVAGASASVIWYVAEWKKGTEIKLQLFDTRTE